MRSGDAGSTTKLTRLVSDTRLHGLVAASLPTLLFLTHGTQCLVRVRQGGAHADLIYVSKQSQNIKQINLRLYQSVRL